MNKNIKRPYIIQSNAVFILLTHGKVAIIDKADLPLIENHNWQVKKSKNTCYARGTKYNLLLHRVILNITDRNILVDHIDGNGLNNCRYNLRECTYQQNVLNVKPRENPDSKYKGIVFDKKEGKWRVRLRIDGKILLIGFFASEMEAAYEYDERIKYIHGQFAWLNFKNNVLPIIRNKPSSIKYSQYEKQIISRAITIAAHLYKIKQEDVFNKTGENYFQCKTCIYYAIRKIFNDRMAYYRMEFFFKKESTTTIAQAINRINNIRQSGKKPKKHEESFLYNADATLSILKKFIAK